MDLSEQEISLRRSLLGSFGAAAAAGSTVLSADKFRDLIAAANLAVGSPELDRVVLECKIDPSGSVRLRDLRHNGGCSRIRE